MTDDTAVHPMRMDSINSIKSHKQFRPANSFTACGREHTYDSPHSCTPSPFDRRSRWYPLEMSDLQKSFAKSKLAKFPPEAPMPDSMSYSEDAWEDGSSTSSLSSTGTMVPSPTRQLFARTGRRFVYFSNFHELNLGSIGYLDQLVF